MRTVKSKEEKNWTHPGVKLTHEEFMAGIRKAEEGPFFTLDEIKAKMQEWKRNRGL
jgi:hypothetical protein